MAHFLPLVAFLAGAQLLWWGLTLALPLSRARKTGTALPTWAWTCLQMSIACLCLAALLEPAGLLLAPPLIFATLLEEATTIASFLPRLALALIASGLTLAVILWVSRSRNWSRPFPALLVGLLLGGVVFFALSSPLARSAITAEAARLNATCLNQQSLWTSFRDIGTRDPHASAWIDGTPHLWRYRTATFIPLEEHFDLVPPCPN